MFDQFTAGFSDIRRRRLLLLVLIGICSVMIGARQLQAGGGPENVFLVVNPRSYDSMTIANHYQTWRGVPSSNVFYLVCDGPTTITDLNAFRTRILAPVFAEIGKRRLSGQIDYVVYSAGFPYGVTLRPKREDEKAEPIASLTSATYLYEFALKDSANLEAFVTNYNMRLLDPVASDRPLGFSSSHSFNEFGRPVADNSGRSYMLSAMLGHTADQGNSLTEILTYLRSAAMADGSRPPGTIYFVRNDDLRSKSRHDVFDVAAQAVRQRGIAAEVISGVTPENKNDVAGVCMGIANFSWASSGCSIVPGAFCDNLTSFGGVMAGGRGQTQLSEFMRFGAAGACGTVAEPTVHGKLRIGERPVDFQTKFPHPLVHAYYASGCSLAEAFYQSLLSPYQQLLVGDPLCQPWALSPRVSVAGMDVSKSVSGSVELAPSATLLHAVVDHYELFVDGVHLADCRDGESITLDSTKLGDGVHELRVVAIEASDIQTQGRAVALFHVDNQGRKISVTRDNPLGRLLPNDSLKITASSPGSSAIWVYVHRDVVAKISGEQGSATIDVSKFGGGPLTLRALGIGASRDLRPVFSEPLLVESEIMPQQPSPGGS